MRVHALQTGTVSVKDAFLHARSGPMRQLALLLPGAFSAPLPIHLWLIEQDGQRILVDAGATSATADLPFATFAVDRELPEALAAAGIGVDDLDTVVLTHLHADHMDGAVHLGDRPILVCDAEIAHAGTLYARTMARLFRQPLPAGARLEPMALDDGPFGAFARSRALTGDGRVVAVATPGHTPGHVSIVCVDDDGRHLLLAGDATDTLEQLRARRADAVAPKPRVMVETIDRILAHAAEHPTVYLPAHDNESAARLAAGATL